MSRPGLDLDYQPPSTVLKVPTPFALCQAVPAPRGFCGLIFLSRILPTRHRQPHDVKKKVKFFPFPSILR